MEDKNILENMSQSTKEKNFTKKEALTKEATIHDCNRSRPSRKSICLVKKTSLQK